MLNNVTHWRKGATLEDIIDTLAKYLDEPEPLYAVNLGKILNNFNFDLIFKSHYRDCSRISQQQRRILSKSSRKG